VTEEAMEIAIDLQSTFLDESRSAIAEDDPVVSGTE
jgi:hypothetical protein